MKIYFAAPLFTLAEVMFNRQLADKIEYVDDHIDLLVPQIECGYLKDPTQICNKCISLIDQSKAVLVNCDGTDVDSGTSLEAGYAFAKGLPVIAYRTDFRRAGDCEDNMNCMVAKVARELLPGPYANINDLAYDLVDAIQRVVWCAE